MSITSWFMRIDRYASVHAVRSQDTVKKDGADSSNSCGIASILMVNFKQKKHLMVAGISTGASIASSGAPLGTFIGGALAKSSFDQAVKEEPEIYKIYGDVTGSTYDGSTTTIAGRCAIPARTARTQAAYAAPSGRPPAEKPPQSRPGTA